MPQQMKRRGPLQDNIRTLDSRSLLGCLCVRFLQMDRGVSVAAQQLVERV